MTTYDITPVAHADLAAANDDAHIELTLQQYNHMVDLVQKLMLDGTDYGVLPGQAGQKKILLSNGTQVDVPNRNLLLPGGEKLAKLFKVSPTYDLVNTIQDFAGSTTGGEPMILYLVRCNLWNEAGHKVGEGLSVCHSWEEKYRYRKAERVCPDCGKETIKISQFEGPPPFGKGSFYCFGKIGGCGHKFADNDPRITQQEQGQRPNERIFDQVQTILMMAQKRAFLKAIRTYTMASAFFTQDMDHAHVQVSKPAQPPVIQSGEDEVHRTWPTIEGVMVDAAPATCRLCGELIWWGTYMDSGAKAPWDTDGTTHFATCTVYLQQQEDKKIRRQALEAGRGPKRVSGPSAAQPEATPSSSPLDDMTEAEATARVADAEQPRLIQLPKGEKATERQIRALDRLVQERFGDQEEAIRIMRNRFGSDTRIVQYWSDLSMDEAGQLLSEWQQRPRHLKGRGR